MPGGATVLVAGTKVTKGGAAFVNAEMMLAGGKWDTFRMLTHPGTAIIPAALVAAEVDGASGRDFITGVAAGYEVMERMAADFIPTVMARGFHAGPVFSIFGAAVAAAKIMRFDRGPGARRDRALRQSGGRATSKARSGGAVARGRRRAQRNAGRRAGASKARSAAARPCSKATAGFYHAYAGNNHGELHLQLHRRHPHQPRQASPRSLGTEWMFLETLYRIYSIAGYNIAHVDVTAQLCEEHDIRYQDVERIEAVVNWLETQYPSPAFPTQREDTGEPRRGSTRFYTRLRRRQARVPVAAPATRRSAGGAGADEAGDDHPVAPDDALRPAHHDLHEGRQELHEAGHRARVHLGLRRGSAPHSRRRPRAARFPRRSSSG